MNYLSNDEKTVFIGQAVQFPGTAMSKTLEDVPKFKMYEMPVCEEMQMGISLGIALDGYVPITIYPRWNFVLLAINQLVNHIDKVPQISNNKFKAKVIIRTGVGSERPLHPQFQHVGDFTEGFEKILTNIEIIRLYNPSDIFPAYKKALNRDDNKSTLIVEISDYYNEK